MKSPPIAIPIFSAMLALASPASAQSDPAPGASARTLYRSADIDATPRELFTSFTTGEGLIRVWLAGQADFDLSIGGRMRVRYTKDGSLDDPATIVNTVLAYEPDRMIAIKPSAPDNAPPFLKKICQTGWNIVRFEPLSDGTRTRLSVTGLGYGEGPDYDQAYTFFGTHNQEVLDHVKALYSKSSAAASAPVMTSPTDHQPKPTAIDSTAFVAFGHIPVDLHKHALVNAAPDAVFAAWTTSAGLKSFLGVESNIDLRIGGPMEIYFGSTQPLGQRGSEGCQILSYVPDKMLSFSWNAPPKFPDERGKRTWIVISLSPVEAGKTRVDLQHLGFGPSEQGHWGEVRTYFDRAWTNVLAALATHFDKPAATPDSNPGK